MSCLSATESPPRMRKRHGSKVPTCTPRDCGRSIQSCQSPPITSCAELSITLTAELADDISLRHTQFSTTFFVTFTNRFWLRWKPVFLNTGLDRIITIWDSEGTCNNYAGTCGYIEAEVCDGGNLHFMPTHWGLLQGARHNTGSLTSGNGLRPKHTKL